MKRFILMALALGISSSALANQSPSDQEVVKAARTTIVLYGFFRMAGLGGAFGGKELEQKQICELAGQAFMAFQVLTAEGVSEAELADMFKDLAQAGLPVDKIRAQVNTDTQDCWL